MSNQTKQGRRPAPLFLIFLSSAKTLPKLAWKSENERPFFESCRSRIFTIHRWIGTKTRYVVLLGNTSQLTVGIRRWRLRSPATARAENG
ncbi:hypothetical protein GQ457_06G010280 [Hibiscus cannabinus]